MEGAESSLGASHPLCVRLASIALLVVVGVGSASCGAEAGLNAGSSTPPAARTGVVFGVVNAGPTCPVAQNGHPYPPRRLAHVLVEARHARGSAVAATRTTLTGAFSLRLPAGRYDLVVMTESFLPRCPTVVATVRPGTRHRLDLRCDTGIR